MQPADLAKVLNVADPAVAPDGTSVAVVVSRVDLDANRTCSAIWSVPVDGSPPRRLTTGDDADAQPRWSPDGRLLAFTRTAKKGERSETSLLVLPVDGPGEPATIAAGPESIGSIAWSPDGTRLAWCARVPEVEPATSDRDRPPRRITTFASRLDDVGWTVDRRSQVHVAPADGTGEVRTVTGGPFEHREVQWSPGGVALVVAAGRHDGWDLDEVVDLWLVDPDADPGADPDAGAGASGLRRLTDGTRLWRHPAWSPDGTRIAAVAYDPSLGWRNPRPYVLDVASGALIDLAPGLDRSFAPTPGDRSPVWEGDATLLASHEDRGRVPLVRLAADGSAAPEPVVEGDCWVNSFHAAAGVVATVVTDPGRLPELEVGEIRTTFTAEFVGEVPPMPVRRFAVASPAGDGDIDAWIVAPEGFDPDEAGGTARWPLLLAIHGGPMTQYGERWFDEFQLLAAAGYVVVAANPHGSSGRTDAWQLAIRSPRAAVEPGTGWGGIDAVDLLAVVDAALQRWPSLDESRVGVLGGSYGGFMTTWLLGTSDRFAAGCTERAVNNLLSEEWSADLAGSFHRELGVRHIDDPDEYLRMSPVTYAAGITAPVLILHSEQDLRCPTEQADALFVALRLGGHRDVEYWRFPGEGHELSRSGSPSHRIHRAEIINAFFERTIAPGPR